jgi:hypothetical protein
MRLDQTDQEDSKGMEETKGGVSTAQLDHGICVILLIGRVLG